jgi:pSer/pThr/pTyr-binding forkhead associated (FHA) protein
MLLIEVKGTEIGNVYPLNKKGPIVLGRSKECDIHILDLKVSRVHCQIDNRDGAFYIRDLNSTNKTVLNRSILESEIKLNLGDIVGIGDTVLIFTDQKKIPVKSVSEFDTIRMNKTKEIDRQYVQ